MGLLHTDLYASTHHGTPHRRTPPEWTGGPIARVMSGRAEIPHVDGPDVAKTTTPKIECAEWPPNVLQRTPRLTVAQVVELRALHANGSPVAQLAQRFSICRRQVYRYLSRPLPQSIPLPQRLWEVIDQWRRERAIEIGREEVLALAASVARICGPLEAVPVVQGPCAIVPYGG
jgi:Helix-turn-helix domain of resolvase